MQKSTLYKRLGGYDGLDSFASQMFPRLQTDSRLGRFWQQRGTENKAREKQLLVDFFCSSAGGPELYSGKPISQQDMKISESEWQSFLGHAGASMEALNIGQSSCDDIVTFVHNLKQDIVE